MLNHIMHSNQQVVTHPVEHLTASFLASLPELPMTQSSDGTWYCDGESTQVVQEQGKNLFDGIVREKDGLYDVNGNFTDNANSDVYYLRKKGSESTYTDSQYIGGIKAFFDSGGNFVSGIHIIDTKTYSFPENAVLCKFAVNKMNQDKKNQIEAGTEATPYEPFQPKMPSPDYPSPITNTYPAGTYKAICGDKVYKVVLDDDLRSVPTYADRVTIDTGRGLMWVERKIKTATLSGIYTGITNVMPYVYAVSFQKTWGVGFQTSMCNRFMNDNGAINNKNGYGIYSDHPTTDYKYFRVNGMGIESQDDFRNWLKNNETILNYSLAKQYWTTTQSIPTRLVTISAGQSAQILNTVNDKADYLKVGGDSWQLVQERGKNIINIQKPISTKNNPVITETTITANADLVESIYAVTLEAGNYVFSVKRNGLYSGITISDSSGNDFINEGSSVDKNYNFSLSNRDAITISIGFGWLNGDASRSVSDIQLESGTEATPYEPFQPAMPSPEYQSEIKDVDGVLRSCGWNYYSGGDIEGTQNENSGTIQTIPPGTYTFMADVESSDTDNTKCFILFYNGTTMLNGVIIGRGKGAQTTVTISENVTKFICYASNTNLNSFGDTFSFRNIQITQGTTPKPYDRHRGNTITLPTLRGLPDGTRDALYVDRRNKKAWVERNVGHIESYNGESVGDVFMSSTGELSTGAVVHYKHSTPVIEELPYSDYLLDTCQWETNFSFVDCDSHLVPEIEVGCKVLGR